MPARFYVCFACWVASATLAGGAAQEHAGAAEGHTPPGGRSVRRRLEGAGKALSEEEDPAACESEVCGAVSPALGLWQRAMTHVVRFGSTDMLETDARADEAPSAAAAMADHQEAIRAAATLKRVVAAIILICALVGGGLLAQQAWGRDASTSAAPGQDLQRRVSHLGGTDSEARWPLILASGWVQVVAGSVYAMGAWQDALRDALELSMSDVSTISAATFLGSLVAFAGGLVFDRLGPRASVALGGTTCTAGYVLIVLSIMAKEALPPSGRLIIAAIGALLAGYSSVSLLDNIVCMACSLSFPGDRAAVVGYLKAVLATAAGLWALLWVHVFQEPAGPGLVAYLGFTAATALGSCMIALYPTQVLPEGPARKPFSSADVKRFVVIVVATVILSVFNVVVSFLFSRKAIDQTPYLGYIGGLLALMPLGLLLFPTGPKAEDEDDGALLAGQSSKGASPASAAVDGVTFPQAVVGLDFWLLWGIQFAVFGSGVATNQNLALILESAGSPEAAGLGVALFALASSVSRMAVGVLSDKYGHVLSRFNWIQVVSALAIGSQTLVSFMNFSGVMFGILMAGLSFGIFFTVVVPVVNEMYGRKQFGVIMGTQLASQALASISICKVLLPAIYSQAARGKAVCIGAECFRGSFLMLAGLNLLGFVAAMVLERRNRDSLPVDRLS